MGVDGSRTPVAVGMCKWTADPVGFDELDLLDRLLPHVDGHTGREDRYLFSRSGFQARLRAHATSDPRLHLLTPGDIYRSTS